MLGHLQELDLGLIVDHVSRGHLPKEASWTFLFRLIIDDYLTRVLIALVRRNKSRQIRCARSGVGRGA